MPTIIPAVGKDSSVRIITLDFETYYDNECSLKKLTYEEYIHHPRFYVMMVSIKINNGETYCVVGEDNCRTELGRLQLGVPNTFVVGQNNRFDASILAWRFGIIPANICCTLLMARVMGLARLQSSSLDNMSSYFRTKGYNIPKKGDAVHNMVGKHLTDISEAQRHDYVEYCKTDTDICYLIFSLFLQLGFPKAHLRYIDLTIKMYVRPRFLLDHKKLDDYVTNLKTVREASLQSLANMVGAPNTIALLSMLRSKNKFQPLFREVTGRDLPLKVSEKKTETARKQLEYIKSQLTHLRAEYNRDPDNASLATKNEIQALNTSWHKIMDNPLLVKNEETNEVVVYDYACSKTDLDFTALLECGDPLVELLVGTKLGVTSSIAITRATRFRDIAARMGWLPFPLEYASAHCVPGETEVLTPDGWMPLTDWNGGTIMQASPDGSLQWDDATRYVGPIVDRWYGWDDKRFPCLFTEGHTMAVRDAWGTMKMGFVSKPVQECNERTRIRAVVSGHLQATGRGLTQLQMRCIMMVQADGNYQADGRAIRLKFIKQRKIDRCVKLLTESGIHFTSNVQTSGATVIRIGVNDVPKWLKGRKLLTPDLWDNPSDVLGAAVEESLYWDGSISVDGSQSYCTSIKSNAEWVATAAHLSGRKAIISTDKQMYVVQLMTRARDNAILYNARFTVSNMSARAYCTQTKTGFWLARYKGVIFITGNTGRYGGADKLNCQNLPARGDTTLRECMLAPEGHTVVVADSSQVEARVLAYIAGEQWLLDVFATGGDPYSSMAADIYYESYETIVTHAKARTTSGTPEHDLHVKYNRYRQIAKQVVLGCGYGMSGNKFAGFLKLMKITLKPDRDGLIQFIQDQIICNHLNPNDKDKLRELGQSYIEAYHLSEAQRINKIYRDKNPAIKALWYKCGDILRALVRGESGYFGGPNGDLLFYDGMHDVCGTPTPGVRLPNGYWILYPNLKVEKDEKTGYDQFSYKLYNGYKYEWVYIYGGKMVENITQGLAFGVMLFQGELINRKYPIALNVHDEWGIVVKSELTDDAIKTMTDAMTTVPDYLVGCPLTCEVETGGSYGTCQ